jgi:hypothetical protein
MRGIAAFCALTFCAGCSLLFASNLEGGDAPPDGTDAASGKDDGSATTDSGTPPSDATSTMDSPVVDADASSHFCASLNPKPKFCDDFDDPTTTIAQRWDRLFISPSNVGVIDLTDVAREGKALSARMTNAADCSYTRLEKDFATDGKDLRLSFSMRPTTPWQTDAIYVMVRLGSSAAATCRIFLQLDTSQGMPSGGFIQFQYGPSQVSDVYSTSNAAKADVWTKIEMTIRANGSVLHTVNGTTAIDQTFPSGCVFTDSVTVGLGYNCENGSPEVRYDDVVVDYP